MSNTKAGPVTLTELEDQLAGPDGAELRDLLLRDLKETERRLTRRLAAMVPRAEFQALDASIEGVRAAKRVLEYWSTGSAKFS